MATMLQSTMTVYADVPATLVHRVRIEHPSAWNVADFKSPADYTIELSRAQLADVADAMQRIKADGLTLETLRREHFEVRSLQPVIDEIRHQISEGRGFVVLHRLPVEDYTKDELGLIFWGIGTHLGRGVSQSVMGDRLGHVKDFSREDPLARAYRNKQELSPHTDLADLVGLACLRDAMSGGVTRLTSAVSMHNVMLAECPDVLERLYRGYVFHRRGEEQPGDLPYTPYRVPIYSNVGGKVSVRYVRSYVEAGETAVGRRMGEDELAVLDSFEQISKRPELMLEFTLRPGEMYFLNNYTILHARTAFDDGDAAEDDRRHLLRLWLEAPWMRQVHSHVHLFESGVGIAAVSGRTPSFDWRPLTSDRIDHGITTPLSSE
jgi:Taurine catabolism dioxygenase TauD, TfdA family